MTKDIFLKEIIFLYNETLIIRRWELNYHNKVELKTKSVLNKEKNLDKATHLISSLMEKRRVLDQQIRVLEMIIRLITHARKLN